MRLIMCLALLCLLSSCALRRVVMDHGELFLAQYVKDKLDLDGEQYKTVRKTIDQHGAWLRKDHLPHVITDLKTLRKNWQDGLTADEIAWVEKRLHHHIETVLSPLVPKAAELLSTLKPEQISHLAEELHESNERFEKILRDKDFADERWDQLERSVGRWYKPITPSMKDFLIKHWGQRAYVETALQNRRAQQSAWLKFLRSSSKAAAPTLQAWLKDQTVLLAENQKGAVRKQRQEWLNGWQQLDAMASAESRKHALEFLDSLIADIDSMRTP